MGRSALRLPCQSISPLVDCFLNTFSNYPVPLELLARGSYFLCWNLTLKRGMVVKKVLVNKPIHPQALDRLAQEVEVLTPFNASPDEVRRMLPGVQGIVLCVGLKISQETL